MEYPCWTFSPPPQPKARYPLRWKWQHGRLNPNDRKRRFLIIDGIARSIPECLKAYGVRKTTFYHRLKTGWTPLEALEGVLERPLPLQHCIPTEEADRCSPGE